jgi:hypothetical protein
LDAQGKSLDSRSLEVCLDELNKKILATIDDIQKDLKRLKFKLKIIRISSFSLNIAYCIMLIKIFF